MNTLKFGGVDTTHNQVNPPAIHRHERHGERRCSACRTYGGTRIIIDKSISSTQSIASTTGGAPTIIQHGVDFAVSGRLNLFQANEIDGDALNPPGQFSDQVSTATGTGGTNVVSGTANVSALPRTSSRSSPARSPAPSAPSGSAGTPPTSRRSSSTPPAPQGARINNYSVGGETNNVLVVAPNGMQNAAFGKGMDTTDILTNVINTLQANRGAINSNVFVDRTISQVRFGGDVVDSNFLTGVAQNFSTIYNAVTGLTTNGHQRPAHAPPPPHRSARSAAA